MTVYQIPSKTTEGRTYTVDLVAGTCNCTAGTHRQPCTHIGSAFLLEREAGRSDIWAKLREEFPASQVSKLPKNVAKEGNASNCNICHGYHRHAAVHLDYVGHAEVTNRLLTVDPLWQWEPMALTAEGLPAFKMAGASPVGLWIRLTVGGVTRLGFGSVEPGKFEAEKELIGDAIRNASMRFGVALDLWAKSDLHAAANDDTPPAPAPRQAASAPAPEPETDPEPGWWIGFKEAAKQAELTAEDLAAVTGEAPTLKRVQAWIDAATDRHFTNFIAEAQRLKARGGKPFE